MAQFTPERSHRTVTTQTARPWEAILSIQRTRGFVSRLRGRRPAQPTSTATPASRPRMRSNFSERSRCANGKRPIGAILTNSSKRRELPSYPLRLTAMCEGNAAKCDAQEDVRVVLDAYICNLSKLSLKYGRKGCSRLPLSHGSMRINESPS